APEPAVIAFALIVRSVDEPSLTDIEPDPGVTVCVTPVVVTVRAPVSEPAAILPARFNTVSGAEPFSVRVLVAAIAAASTVTLPPAALSVIDAAAEPVAMLTGVVPVTVTVS